MVGRPLRQCLFSLALRRSVVGSLLVAAGAFGCQGDRDYRIAVPGGSVILSSTFWEPLPNTEPFAVNFQARDTSLGETGPSVLTLFRGPRRRNQPGSIAEMGLAIDSGVFVWFNDLGPFVKAEVQLDRDGFWAVLQQTLRPPEGQRAGISANPEDQRWFLEQFAFNVQRARTILAALVVEPAER